MLNRTGMALVALALLAGGCSRTELLYDNADWLAHRWTSRLVDASEAQRSAWREPFRALLLDHRRQLLPELLALLQTLQGEVERGLTRQRLDCLAEGVHRLYRAHARLAVPLATRVLLALGPRQIDHLEAELGERNAEYRQDYLDDDPLRREQRRIARYVERIERWTGTLSTVQLGVVERRVAAIPDSAGDWLAYRERQQRRLLAQLRAGVGREGLARLLERWWVGLADRPAALRDKVERVRSTTFDLVLTLDDMLEPVQRDRLVARLTELRADLQGFVDAPAPAAIARGLLDDCGGLADASDRRYIDHPADRVGGTVAWFWTSDTNRAGHAS